MRSYSVSARGLAAIEVRGANWIVALGSGLEALGKAADIARLACEVLPNGTVIARDISTGTGYIVQEVEGVAASEDAPSEELEFLPADAIELVPDERPLDMIEEAETAQAACQVALDLGRERVPAESGAVILTDKGYLRFHAVVGPHARKLAGIRLPLGTGVAGFAMGKRRSVVLADAQQDPRHCAEVDALTGYVTRQILVVPIQSDDAVFGVLELMNLPAGRRFSEQDVDRVVEVAGALARRISRG